jgi:protein-L-isoaspartate(D-aspartate) O-methyltransferase
MNYDLLRKRMVETQLVERGINDSRVLEAFYKVHRHLFVPRENQPDSYSDFPLPIGANQTISQPYIVALMSERLGLTGKEKVLEIGTGSGYQTAILAELSKEVYTIETVPELAQNSRKLLEKLGYKNIFLKTGDGTLGWEEAAPFDRVIITAYCPEVPAPLKEQLKEKGKIILPLGGVSGQMLTLVGKKDGVLEYQDICPCVFVPLIGAYGV